MKRIQWRNIALALTLALAMFGASAKAAVPTVTINGEERPAYREGEVIVKYKDGAIRTRNMMESLYTRLSVVGVKRYAGHLKSFEHLKFNSASLSVEAAVADLQRDPTVEYAQPNYMIYAMPAKLEKPKTLGEPCLIPGIPFPPGCDDSGGGGGGNPPPPGGGQRPAIQPAPAEVNPPVADPDLAKAWGITKVAADKAWATQKGSKNVIVAVIDTGIDYNHPDLAFNMWRNPAATQIARTGIDASGSNISGDIVGWDFIHNDNLPYDDNQHGTHCAGVIGAVGGDGKGIAGVNHRVSLMAIKFLSGQGSGDTAGAIGGIDYAVSRGAKVLSNSWGGKGDDGSNGALKEAVERTAKAGVLFVAAAGNDGTDNDRDPVFPASYNIENMVTVAATTEQDGIAFFSNKGVKSVHVGAPGTNVYSTTPNNSYAKLSGTSMACPHVAGAAALLWAQYPNESYAQIKKRLLDNGDAINALNGKTVTGKRINVSKSLEAKL